MIIIIISGRGVCPLEISPVFTFGPKKGLWMEHVQACSAVTKLVFNGRVLEEQEAPLLHSLDKMGLW